MNLLKTEKEYEFSNFMKKVETVGFLLLNNESVLNDSRQSLSVPKAFQGFMNSQDLI